MSLVDDYNEKHPPRRGDVREWKRCNDCSKIYSYDYLPYSIGNPVRWTPCGHSDGRNLNATTVPVEEAEAYFQKLADEKVEEAPACPTFNRG